MPAQADLQFKEVKGHLSKIFEADIALYTMFMQPGSISNAFDVWGAHALDGFSTMFTSTEARADAYGFSKGAEARLALIDLRTMKIEILDEPSIPRLIEACEAL